MQPKSRAALRQSAPPPGNGTGGIVCRLRSELFCRAFLVLCRRLFSGCSADCGAVSCDAGVSAPWNRRKNHPKNPCLSGIPGCTGTETTDCRGAQNFDSERSSERIAYRTWLLPASVLLWKSIRGAGAVGRKTTGTGSRLDGPCSRRYPATYDGIRPHRAQSRNILAHPDTGTRPSAEREPQVETVLFQQLIDVVWLIASPSSKVNASLVPESSLACHVRSRLI